MPRQQAVDGRRNYNRPVACLSLPYRAPFDWPGLLTYLSVRALPGVEQVEGDLWRRVVRTPRGAAWLEVRPARRGARLELHVVDALDAGTRDDWTRRARHLFDLDLDPARLRADLGHDPLIGPLIARQPGLRVPGAWDGFELAVRAVLGQQVSVRGATTLAGRVVRACGEPLAPAPSPPGLTHLFPTPAALARADLSTIGLTGARRRTLAQLGAAVAAGLRLGPESDGAATRAHLQALPGIGPWTAEYVALRALRDADALPVGDLGLRRALAREGRPASAQELHDAAEALRPWRGYAAMALWRHDAQAAPTPRTRRAREAA